MNRLEVHSKVLVIAQSARMLAQMASDSGFVPVVIDCFADLDTRQCALDTIKVVSLRVADIQPALEAVRNAHGVMRLVYGSGFEGYTETLDFLERDWIVLGNSVEVFRAFQNKSVWFARLAALSIVYPETVFSAPQEEGNWLVKPVRGEGGKDIRQYDPASVLDSNDCYWQRFVQGETLSVSFIACSGKVKILGFNRQWATSIDDDHPFLFNGVANHTEISDAQQALVFEWLEKLVKAYPLRGLGSLDFIVGDGCCYLLEVNARIPASAQLYGKSILMLHVQACLGGLDDGVIDQSAPCAYQVIYAKNRIRIPELVNWPKWAVDRPPCGAIIGKGQPICSIIAAGNSPREVSDHLLRRQKIIENCLNTGF